MTEGPHPITADRFSRQCRKSLRKPQTWVELVDSGMDEYEIAIAMLNACKELIEEQEQEIAELKLKLEIANASLQHSTV